MLGCVIDDFFSFEELVGIIKTLKYLDVCEHGSNSVVVLVVSRPSSFAYISLAPGVNRTVEKFARAPVPSVVNTSKAIMPISINS